MSKTVRLIVYFPLRFFSFIPTLLHARVTVDKGCPPPEQFGVPMPVTLRALHTHMLPWAGTKGPFFPQCRKTVVIHA